MKNDVGFIQREPGDDGRVFMPLEVYEELRQFCRSHGETDLPSFAPTSVVEPLVAPVVAPVEDKGTSPITQEVTDVFVGTPKRKSWKNTIVEDVEGQDG